jgi:hypothetical protein
MIHPESVVAGAVLLGGWLAAWRARGQRPGAGPAGALLGGLLAGGAALNGPLHDLAEAGLFSAHMVQHLLLTLVMPPLLLAATPPWMMDRLLAVPLAWGPLRRLALTVTRPVPALALFAATLIAWHLPPAFDRALDHRCRGGAVLGRGREPGRPAAGRCPHVGAGRRGPGGGLHGRVLSLGGLRIRRDRRVKPVRADPVDPIEGRDYTK